MPGLAGLAFTFPWALTALAALPVLWWLLRVTPPSPRHVTFPALRYLLALRPVEETPARTPWWLILLRMLVAALIILAVAHPVLNPGLRLLGTGPLILVIDNGWASASDWPARQTKILELLDHAEREGRPVHLLATAPQTGDQPIRISELMRPDEAKSLVSGLAPRPWPVDRTGALAALQSISPNGSSHSVWITDGIDSEDARSLAGRLQSFGSLTVLEQPFPGVRLLQQPDVDGNELSIPVVRIDAPGEQEFWVRAVSDDGRLIGRERGRFEEGSGTTRVSMVLPGEIRNEIARIEVEGGNNAGEVFLMDERWRRRPVGIVSGDVSEAEQPLLSSIYYLERALGPFAEARRGNVDELLSRELSVLVLADIGTLLESDVDSLQAWMTRGGVTLRFAGPKLAASEDALVPVKLRRGGRVLGGAISWAKPVPLLPFEQTSPFAGLAPPEDVTIHRQVLAQPDLSLSRKTWARLADGTPLVTAEKRGRGWLVLVHTTANTDWSNLPISGLFVEMLRRIVDLSIGVAGVDADAVLPAWQTLGSFGQLGPPPPDTSGIPARDFETTRAAAATPPGYYGNEDLRRALNLSSGMQALAPIGELPAGVERRALAALPTLDFKPWLLLAALILALADLILSFGLRGLIGLRRTHSAVTGGVLLLAIVLAAPVSHEALAQQVTPRTGPDARALEATLTTRLAYVTTGDSALDRMTMAGLRGLSEVLQRRTAVEAGEPLAVDIEEDELAFYPLLYWAVSPAQRPLSQRARGKLNTYLRTGGTVLFDTREQGGMAPGSPSGVGDAGLRLRRILRGLDVPLLIQTPPDHVLTRAFYLLDDFPGRWAGGPVWVENRGGRHNDGVSSIIVGANDWAGAWAVDTLGRPMVAVVPDGERQREMAYRFGVNWVMYALTGNYKTDQVHIPTIMERLGH